MHTPPMSRRAFGRHTFVVSCFAIAALDGCSSSSGSSNHADGATGNEGSAGGASGAGNAATGGSSSAAGGDTGAGGAASTGPSTASEIATKLGRTHFLIGMGNDLNNDHDQDGAYTLGTTLDVHYAYLVGLLGQGGWPDWNSGGTFVNVLTDSAKKHGVVPMFTLYSMAAQGEGNIAALTSDGYMKPYWDGAKLMFQRLGVFGGPAIVQFEPDFWGFVQQKAPGGDPSQLAGAREVARRRIARPNRDTLVGMGQCLVALGRKYAPQTVLGFHASAWADSDPAKIASFLVKVGAAEADIITTDTLDRDAGCFEAHTDPNCQRSGTFYWDETNQTSPNFHDHLAWVKQMVQGVGKPMLWWQTPFGVPSTTPGGTSGKYRDNRVHYISQSRRRIHRGRRPRRRVRHWRGQPDVHRHGRRSVQDRGREILCVTDAAPLITLLAGLRGARLGTRCLRHTGGERPRYRRTRRRERA